MYPDNFSVSVSHRWNWRLNMTRLAVQSSEPTSIIMQFPHLKLTLCSNYKVKNKGGDRTSTSYIFGQFEDTAKQSQTSKCLDIEKTLKIVRINFSRDPWTHAAHSRRDLWPPSRALTLECGAPTKTDVPGSLGPRPWPRTLSPCTEIRPRTRAPYTDTAADIKCPI